MEGEGYREEKGRRGRKWRGGEGMRGEGKSPRV